MRRDRALGGRLAAGEQAACGGFLVRDEIGVAERPSGSAWPIGSPPASMPSSSLASRNVPPHPDARPTPHAGLSRVLGQKRETGAVILLAKEHSLQPVATLRHIVGIAGTTMRAR
jgi:hypothetical protein